MPIPKNEKRWLQSTGKMRPYDTKSSLKIKCPWAFWGICLSNVKYQLALLE